MAAAGSQAGGQCLLACLCSWNRRRLLFPLFSYDAWEGPVFYEYYYWYRCSASNKASHQAPKIVLRVSHPATQPHCLCHRDSLSVYLVTDWVRDAHPG